MKTPHKHAAVIKAWADGAQVQERRSCYGTWKDVGENGAAVLFSNSSDYRVKPEPLKYRLCLCKDYAGHHYVGAFNEGFGQTVQGCEQGSSFVKWIDTNWQEVEV